MSFIDVAETRFPSFAMFTDAAPMKTGGHGCQLLAWNLAQAIGPDLKLVITHRKSANCDKRKVSRDLSIPSVFYPDLAAVPGRGRRLNALRSIMELGLFQAWLPRGSGLVKASGAQRLFAFLTNNAWFLIAARSLARRSDLPLDIYLVDDLEDSARLQGLYAQARFFRWLEPKFLHKAERVFVISPGYSQHLATKYGIGAEWLPVAIPKQRIQYQPFKPQDPDVRTLTFIGAVNPLYLDGLRDCLRAIRAWNSERHGYKFRLLLMTYASRDYIDQAIGTGADIQVLIRPAPEEFENRLRESWAVFLPYSFKQSVRIMVNTSFPTKMTESLTAGRPVLVYGPRAASVPRYFIEHDLPVLVDAPEGLMQGLAEIGRFDTPQLISRYEHVVQSVHSPERLRAVLGRIKSQPLELTCQ